MIARTSERKRSVGEEVGSRAMLAGEGLVRRASKRGPSKRGRRGRPDQLRADSYRVVPASPRLLNNFPYGRDPRDRNIRIAPSLPPLEEIRQAMELLAICVQLAAIESGK